MNILKYTMFVCFCCLFHVYKFTYAYTYMYAFTYVYILYTELKVFAYYFLLFSIRNSVVKLMTSFIYCRSGWTIQPGLPRQYTRLNAYICWVLYGNLWLSVRVQYFCAYTKIQICLRLVFKLGLIFFQSFWLVLYRTWLILNKFVHFLKWFDFFQIDLDFFSNYITFFKWR